MVAISPFRALRYDSKRTGDLKHVIAPPYDVIDPDEQEALYQASPHNVVRLILGKQSPSDTEADNRYTRAQMDFTAWRDSGLLRRDEQPALYLVRHTFTDEGGAAITRLGFIAVIDLDEETTRQVYRHEATLAAPKADRTKLLQAVPASLEPIFCVYPDEHGTIQALLQEAAGRSAPAVDTTLKQDGVQMWAMTDAAVVDRVRAHIGSVNVLIADGHHRFEVGLAGRARAPQLMTYFVSMADPALIIRPIHRLVAPKTGGGLERLKELCAVDRVADLGAVLGWLGQGAAKGRFGWYDGQGFYRVETKADALARWLMSPSVPLPLATLDVSILHGLLLPASGVNGTGVTYTGETVKALQAVEQGRAGSTWLLRGIPLTQVYALASQGLVLSPKSTYFYPKVPSGLVMHPFGAG